MSTPVLATKLHIPRVRSKTVLRPRLIDRLNEGLFQNQGFGRALTLISAPAGFGKTTLVSEWATSCERLEPNVRVAWLSLDQGDSDPTRFLIYLVAALQTIAPNIGEGVLGALYAAQPQPPPFESILTALLNEITAIPNNFVLVLDDYHVVDAKPVDNALTYLFEHQPPQMHLVITTREDPQLPLARLRAQGQLVELRAADLRFTPSEATGFLNQVMGLDLSADDIAVLETRTEGWIAGLQLAAISLQGNQDTTDFIRSFTGSHRFVMDYLVEQVLQQQSESVQTFLLRTSILDRLCGPLCDAVLGKDEGGWIASRDEDRSQFDGDSSFRLRPSSFTLAPHASAGVLEYLEHANLFIVPLDNERLWYRYHHLFADLLQQRLFQSFASSTEDAQKRVNELHIRASQWYEENGLGLEAFHHAAAGNDIERAERLIEGGQIPRHLRGAVKTVLDWLESLPTTVLNARPTLWWRYAGLLLVNGQTTGVEEKLDAAEAALQGVEPDDKTRHLVGRIATARATLALTRYQVETMLAQSRRALEYLPHDDMSHRANAYWTLAVAYHFQGDRVAASRAYTEAISISQVSGDIFTTILATIGLGNMQEAANQLYPATETYRRVLQLAGEQPPQIVYEAHLGIARTLYEWNDLDAAEQYGQQSLKLARQYERVIDRYIICEVFLARLKLARGDVAGADAMLSQTSQTARQHNFVYRIPEVVAAQVLTLLRRGNPAAAAHLIEIHDLPISRARIYLAQGDTSAALAVLEPLRQQVVAKGWQDEQLKVMVLQAIALYAQGEKDHAVQLLGDALALAEPGGFIRLFVDEGIPMAQLLSEAATRGTKPDYIGKLLAIFKAEEQKSQDKSVLPSDLHAQPLIEPLSQRELEILKLIAQGLSNHEISARLFLALSTVKGHNLKIFGKLQVQRRTEAVARARELGLL